MPGHSGSHLGIIDLVLTRQSLGHRNWTVRSAAAGLRQASGAAGLPSRLLYHAIAPDHRAALAWSRRVIGETRVPLHTHFATLAPSAAITLIAEAKLAYVRRALAGSVWEGMPILSSAAPFRSGGRAGAANYTDIPAGPLRMRSLSDLYLYPNTVVTLALTGADVADWLEQSAALFRQITPGAQDAVLHDTAVPSFTFDVITGVSFAIDLSQPPRFDPHGRLINPAARRIVGLCRDGRLISPDDRLLLVTNNHRASRAQAQAIGSAPTVALADGARSQAVLGDHLRSEGIVGTHSDQSWRFLPMPGTSVIAAAGPGSAAHLGDIAVYRPEPAGTDAEGFCLYRLHL
jgi:2',3'-cyclic-nucleotide 2'-phosphodiesterase/3'-nucleotidase